MKKLILLLLLGFLFSCKTETSIKNKSANNFITNIKKTNTRIKYKNKITLNESKYINLARENKLNFNEVAHEVYDNENLKLEIDNKILDVKNERKAAYVKMNFKEFWNEFQIAIKNKDFDILKGLSNLSVKSTLKFEDFENEFSSIMTDYALKKIAQTKDAKINTDYTSSGGKSKVISVYEGATYDDGSVYKTIMKFHFQKTKLGWKLVVINIIG